MEIDKDKWITVAHENISRYMDRGGEDQGDIPELLEGAQLLNTIGIALNVHFSDPTSWTEEEIEEAEFGHLCFFKNESRKAIDAIVKKIAEECKGKERFLITVIPLQLYADGKLYSLSLFRFKAKTKWKFIDNVGRVYKNFADWKENNVLPPGKVCYPLDGHLQRNCKGYIQTRCKSTPYGSNQAKLMRTADISTGVIGIVGAVGTLFVTGGAALPFVVAGVGSAIYSTARSVYHLVDRGSHNQSVDPLESHETFSLWLGIGANVISFGAMGATIRLSTLAFQGKNVSQGFRLLVNIVNGTSIGVNSVAVANSLAYMAIHFEEMTPMDVLMQVASVAFWAKSIFSYKPAASIVKEIHNQVLNGYSTALGHSQDDFNNFRVKFNNDKQLVKFYFRYLKQGLDPAQVSDVLVEIYQMGAGAKIFSVDPAHMTVNINGHTFTMEFLMSIKSCNRQTVFNILANMNEKQAKTFDKLRSQVQDDVALFYLIAEVSKDFSVKPEDSARNLITFWDEIDDNTSKISPSIKINKDNSIILGNGFTFNIDQIVKFASNPGILKVIRENFIQFDTNETMKFELLRKVFNDDIKLFDWIAETEKTEIGNTIETLFELKSRETGDLHLFDLIELVPSLENESGMILVKNILKVSIFFLHQLDTKLLNQLIQMINETEIVDETLKNFNELIGTFRVQAEFNRKKAYEWFNEVSEKYRRIVSRYEQPAADELNCLWSIKSLMSSFEHESQLVIAGFAFNLNPKNIGDFCACCDFACSYLFNAMEKCSQQQFEARKLAIKEETESFGRWKEKTAIDEMKNSCRISKLEHAKLKMTVTRNKMFDNNPVAVKKGLPGKDLVRSIVMKSKSCNIKFQSEALAIAQLFKKSKYDVRKFIDRANFIIKDSKSKSHVRRCQEGVSRIIEFTSIRGRVEMIEKYGKVFLINIDEFHHK